MLADDIIADIDATLHVGTYVFASEDQRDRHRRSAARVSGPVVLWDLLKVLQEVGLGKIPVLTPRSIFRPEMLIPPLKRYLAPPTVRCNEEILRQSFEKVRRMFHVGKLEPIKLEEVVFDGTTNSGAPFFGRKADYYRESLSYAKATQKGRAPDPLTVFHRGKDEKVARPVFGYPFSMTLLESQFFQPYQAELVNHHTPYVGGQINLQISALINEIRCKSESMVELDYSGFDGSLSAKLISLAFSCIKSNFVMTKQQEKDWSTVTRYFVTGPMLLPDGSLIKGRRHGVPSGSMFTQIIDSICNALIIEYCARRLRVKPTRYCVLGDDSVIGLPVKLNVSDWAEVASELGVKINNDKSRGYWVTKEKETHFLGHDRAKFVLSRDVEDSVVRLLTPERLRDEYFSKDPVVRKAAYIERLKAYQDDNLVAWGLFERAISHLLGKEGPQWSSQWFTSSKELAIRGKWDPELVRRLSRKSEYTYRILLDACKT